MKFFWGGIESLFSSTRDGLTNARRDTTATRAVDSLPEDKGCVVLGELQLLVEARRV